MVVVLCIAPCLSRGWKVLQKVRSFPIPKSGAEAPPAALLTLPAGTPCDWRYKGLAVHVGSPRRVTGAEAGGLHSPKWPLLLACG